MAQTTIETLRANVAFFDGEITRLERAAADLQHRKPWLDAELSLTAAQIDHDLRRARVFRQGTLAAIVEHETQA